MQQTLLHNVTICTSAVYGGSMRVETENTDEATFNWLIKIHDLIKAFNLIDFVLSLSIEACSSMSNPFAS